MKKKFGTWIKTNWVACVTFFVLLCLYAGLLVYANYKPAADESGAVTASAATTYEKAEIVNISYDNVTPDHNNDYNYDEIETGKQIMMLRLLTGDHKGELQETTVNISLFTPLKLRVGEKVVVIQTVDTATGAIQSLTVNDRWRIPVVIALVCAFFAITALVGGKTGIKSLLGLVLTVIALIWIFIPLLMKGAYPAPTALLICVLVAALCFLLLGGLNKKTVTAMLGTVAGMGLAALFSLLAQKLLQITSYSMYNTDPQIDVFVQTQWMGVPLHITGLLTAGIIISALGAVMDVAMSLSSAVNELKTVDPGLGFRQLWRSGMNIGRDMVGTMTNTLILAFVGSSLVILIFTWIQTPDPKLLYNSSFLAVELVSGLSSSVGLILAVPLTALIAAGLFGTKKTK